MKAALAMLCLVACGTAGRATDPYAAHLVELHRAYRAGHVQDPTGIATLGTVLDEPDMRDFQERWQAATYFLNEP